MAPPRSAVAAKIQKEQDDLLPSEDEEDEDFTLEAGEGDSGGSDSSDSERESGPVSKRTKVEEKPAEPALDKSAVDDLWASFNDPTVDPYASTSSAPTSQPAQSTSTTTSAAPTTTLSEVKKGKAKANLDQSDLVTIKVIYKFAGDTITQDKKVPRDSQEARNYFALHPEALNSSSSTSSPASTIPPKPSDPTSYSLDALFGPESESNTTPSATNNNGESVSSASASPAPPLSKPPSAARPSGPPAAANKRKKAGGGLGAMAASLGVGSKPAKLNTLEKSKLDWNQYVQTQDGLEDTLQHARKDGYLEKKDFLDRVEMRKEEGWEKGRKKGGR
ncbi:hypothetical protein JCM5350_005127 [Sporobolomyces pararoseus]